MNVAELFVELVTRAGVSHVFTVPGGTALPLMEALSKSKLRVVVCKDELGAAFMADGYAWASGKLGVVVTIGGPGATNAITGLCCSAAQGNPVLLVSGEVATSTSGKRAAQDSTCLGIDVAAISRPATALSASVGSAHDAATALAEAVRRALRMRKPTHVAIPLDVQRVEVPERALRRLQVSEVDCASAPPKSIREASALLRQAGRRVALLVGRGGRGAGAEILQLAERLNAPVATTCGGKGIFPEHHPLSVGVFSFGGGPLGRAVMTSGVDVLLAIGTGLGEFATMNYADALNPELALVHVDCDASVFGRTYASLPICGDAREVCRALLEALPGAGENSSPRWLSALQTSHDRFAEAGRMTDSTTPLRPERLMHEIERVLPVDACVVADIGTSCLFVAHYLRVSPPQRCYIPMVWSCMGHPLGAALGVRLGSGAPTICVTGDAAFMAKGLELHAAVEQGVAGLVVVVLSNRGHGLVRLGTAAIVGEGHGVEDGTFGFTPDIAAIARAVGARAHSVRKPEELAPALEDALRCGGPCVVEVHVDPNAAPPMAERIQGLGSGAARSASAR